MRGKRQVSRQTDRRADRWLGRRADRRAHRQGGYLLGRQRDMANQKDKMSHLNEAHDLVKLVLADNRPHAAVLSQGVTLLDGFCSLLQLLVEGRRNALLHQQP